MSARVSVIAAAKRARVIELASDVEAEPRDPDAALERQFDQMSRLEGADTELRGQVALRLRAAIREPHQDADVGRGARELVQLHPVVDDEGSHALRRSPRRSRRAS